MVQQRGGQVEEDTAQSSLDEPMVIIGKQISTSPIVQPPTRVDKGKANVGLPTIAGKIAPPVPTTTVPDDITLADDPDVIELEDEILDRYLAITAARVPA
jgi:hypothetical protein